MPSNFNDDGSRGSNTPTTGVAVPGTDGTDTASNNTGTGPGGEDNVYTVAPAGIVLNGPNGQPAATGPTGNNDDFTNLSTPIPAGTAPGATDRARRRDLHQHAAKPRRGPHQRQHLLVPQPPAACRAERRPTCPPARASRSPTAGRAPFTPTTARTGR